MTFSCELLKQIHHTMRKRLKWKQKRALYTFAICFHFIGENNDKAKHGNKLHHCE